MTKQKKLFQKKCIIILPSSQKPLKQKSLFVFTHTSVTFTSLTTEKLWLSSSFWRYRIATRHKCSERAQWAEWAYFPFGPVGLVAPFASSLFFSAWSFVHFGTKADLGTGQMTLKWQAKWSRDTGQNFSWNTEKFFLDPRKIFSGASGFFLWFWQ